MSEDGNNQELDELLRGVAEEDRRLEPSSRVERHIMAFWDSAVAPESEAARADAPAAGPARTDWSPNARLARVWERLAGRYGWWLVPTCGAAAVALALLFGGRTRSSEPLQPTLAPSVMRGTGSRTAAPFAAQPPGPSSAALVNSASGAVPEAAGTRNPQPAQKARTQRPDPQFVPLVPMGEHDLSGPLQLVRVRMRRAALAGLGVPLDINRVGDPVQADVLLGEDGMARAIRISSETDLGGFR